MNRFLVSTRPAPDLEAAVFAIGAVSPMDALVEVEQDLRQKRITGKVVFDLLLSHGNRANRYFIGDFDGQRFRSARFESAKDRYSDLAPVSARFLREHVSEVDHSLLSGAMQFALKKGVLL